MYIHIYFLQNIPLAYNDIYNPNPLPSIVSSLPIIHCIYTSKLSNEHSIPLSLNIQYTRRARPFTFHRNNPI